VIHARPPLTDRERDSLALVADGKTGWEISVIPGISEATARFHVDNGRRKLGAVTRAQAVARLALQRMI
jgi:LuxR family quorum sensing-dependent transcriptional regulator